MAGNSLALLLLFAAACNGATDGPPRRRPPAPEPWPELPVHAEAAGALAKRMTNRPPAQVPVIDAAAVTAAIRRAIVAGEARSGWDAVITELSARLQQAGERDAYLLCGTTHDARVQVEAFRRLFGPSGVGTGPALVLELFDAEGRWRGVEPRAQRGDSETIARYLRDGARDDHDALGRALAEDAYTAWKYDYVDAALDVLVTARATGQPALGCDMPLPLQRRARGVREDALDRLREIHCMLAVRDAVPAPRRVAMLWGDAHVGPQGIARFLPADATVVAIHFLGGRAGDAGIERELAERLAVTEPLLVPLQRDRLVLLLAAPPIGARLDRRRSTLGRPADADLRERLVVTSTVGGTLHLRHGTFDVDETARAIPVTPGTHPWLLDAGDQILTGSIEIPALGYAELDIDSPSGIASTLVHLP